MLNKKKEKSNRKKKVHRIIGSFFSPLPDVLVQITGFLKNNCPQAAETMLVGFLRAGPGFH